MIAFLFAWQSLIGSCIGTFTAFLLSYWMDSRARERDVKNRNMTTIIGAFCRIKKDNATDRQNYSKWAEENLGISGKDLALAEKLAYPTEITE